MSSLTNLPPPSLRPAVLGLLVAVSGISAPAQEPQAPFPSLESLPTPTMEVREGLLAANFAGPGVVDFTSQAVAPFSLPAPTFQHHSDGTTVVTIRWDTNDGESVARHSADLVLTASPIPEPTPVFLGACAGCVFLLYRRRAMPSKLRPARVNLSASVSATRRASRLASAESQRSARAPRERRAPRQHRPASGPDAYTGRLFPGHPRLSRPRRGSLSW